MDPFQIVVLIVAAILVGSFLVAKVLNLLPPFVFSILNWITAFCLLLGGIFAFAAGEILIGVVLFLSFAVTIYAFISSRNEK